MWFIKIIVTKNAVKDVFKRFAVIRKFLKTLMNVNATVIFDFVSI